MIFLYLDQNNVKMFFGKYKKTNIEIAFTNFNSCFTLFYIFTVQSKEDNSSFN